MGTLRSQLEERYADADAELDNTIFACILLELRSCLCTQACCSADALTQLLSQSKCGYWPEAPVQCFARASNCTPACAAFVEISWQPSCPWPAWQPGLLVPPLAAGQQQLGRLPLQLHGDFQLRYLPLLLCCMCAAPQTMRQELGLSHGTSDGGQRMINGKPDAEQAGCRHHHVQHLHIVYSSYSSSAGLLRCAAPVASTRPEVPHAKAFCVPLPAL